MSTIKVNNIDPPNVGEGVSIDGLQIPTAGSFSNRNLIINGAMQVAQRGTSKTGQTALDGYVALDRYRIQLNTSGTFTISQSTEAPDGFSNSLKFDCTTADASPNYLVFFQLLEGQDLQQIQKGKSGAQKLTASFYVRSSKTGTYQVNLRDLDNDRIIGSSYAISSVNTWEYKSVTFAADTVGQFGNDNGASLQLEWWLASGSTYSSGAVPTAWETRSNADRAAALDVNIGASTDDDFYITGVQLEVGSKATPFEHQSFGNELLKCQRYYQTTGKTVSPSYPGPPTNHYGGYVGATYPNNSSCYGTAAFKTTMRELPSIVLYDGVGASGKTTQNGIAHGIAASAALINISGFLVITKASGTWFNDARYTIVSGYTADAEL